MRRCIALSFTLALFVSVAACGDDDTDDGDLLPDAGVEADAAADEDLDAELDAPPSPPPTTRRRPALTARRLPG